MATRHWVASLALIAAPATAFGWHNHLTKSLPAADSASTAPGEIRLWFAEKVDPKLSSISLLKADSSKVEIAKVEGTDEPVSISAKVAAPLAPGGYVVVWRTAGDDGHAVRGKYAFAVK